MLHGTSLINPTNPKKLSSFLIGNAGNGERLIWCHLVSEPELMLATAGGRVPSSARCSTMQNDESSVVQGMVP